MAVCLVLAHPERSSLSYQIFHELASILEADNVRVFRQDLYADGFDPVMPLNEIKRRMSLDPLVSRYGRELIESSGVVVIHPDWWSSPPAILKGWVDRVFRPGTAYDEFRDFPGDEAEFLPGLTGKRAAAVVISHKAAGSEAFLNFWRNSVFSWCGTENFTLHHLADSRDADEGRTGDWKRNTVKTLAEAFRE
ncbi:MAG: NAD(P)H-dependent oxidoreductase [Spirochaetales bacterium]|nr:NAD(P)H-dependent oxidoreductase [Spirochaetales bacterium]